MKLPVSRTVPIVMAYLLLLGLTSAAQDDSGRFRWSWEEGGAEGPAETEAAPGSLPAGMADEYEKLIRDNLELRRENAGLEQRYEDARKKSEELLGKVKTFERRGPSGGPAPEAASGQTAALSSELEKARGDNRQLREQINTLSSELEAWRKQQRAAPATTATVAQESDLYKRQAEEMNKLRDRLAALKQEEQRASKEKNELTGETQLLRDDMAALKEQMDQLEEERNALKRISEGLYEGADEAQQLKTKLAEMQREADQRDALLARNERELKRLQRKVETAQVEAPKTQLAQAAAKVGEEDFYFNMAVLYAQTGMHRQAEKEFLRLLETDKSKADVHYNLGILYDKYLNNKRKARKNYEQFLAQAPDSSDADRVRVWLLELDLGFGHR